MTRISLLFLIALLVPRRCLPRTRRTTRFMNFTLAMHTSVGTTTPIL